MNINLAYDSFSTIPPECFQSLDQWKAPSGHQIKSALRQANLSAEDFSKIIGVEGRTVRRWSCDEVVIPYASWCLLCLEAGCSKFWGKSDYILR